jgi:hypothetical protein
MIDFLDRCLDAFPQFDFRAPGMGILDSALFLWALVLAFGSKYVITGKKK